MLIEIDLQYLKQERITAHQYLILKLALDNKHKTLYLYLRATDTHSSLFEDWKYLYSLGLLSEPPDEYVNVNKIKPTSEFLKDMSYTEDPFEEFYKTYPVKVLRPDGGYDYLRMDRKRCKKIYNNIIVGNPSKHKFIMECLKKEIKYRESNGSMRFMKRMPMWLTSEAWTTFADMVEDDHESIPDENTIGYGTDIE